ncbi:unnamed protein product [Rhizophagus irregularis]|nr:unnamed protein product [Rhizophagus irregularis]CAB5295483.1 unnamed protein product [Rhizophagus irregularis]
MDMEINFREKYYIMMELILIGQRNFGRFIFFIFVNKYLSANAAPILSILWSNITSLDKFFIRLSHQAEPFLKLNELLENPQDSDH